MPHSEEKFRLAVGRRLKQARNAACLTMRRVQAETGCAPAYICDCENGRMQPAAYNLVLLAKLYDVSIDWLLTGSPDDDGGETVDPADARYYRGPGAADR